MKNKWKKLTEKDKEEIYQFWKAHPEVSIKEIAEKFNTYYYKASITISQQHFKFRNREK